MTDSEEWVGTDRGRDHPPAPKHVEKDADQIAGEAYQVIGAMLDHFGVWEQPWAQGLLDYFSKKWRGAGAEILPFTIPREGKPPPGLLMSMAIRSDHALAMNGYYDQELFAGTGITHKQRLEGTLSAMSQLWEEVVGLGFYKPELEADYARQAERILRGNKCEDDLQVPAAGDGRTASPAPDEFEDPDGSVSGC